MLIGIKLDFFYRKYGDRGFLVLLFMSGLVLQMIFSLRMAAPSLYPEEFVTAAWSGFLAGAYEVDTADFSVFADTGTLVSEWLLPALYAPLHYLIRSPNVLYHSMLLLNGVIAALVPLFTYKLTALLGLEKAWQRVLAAVTAAVTTAVFAYSKFLLTEILSVFLPLLTIYLLLTTAKTKHRAGLFLLSLLTAFTLAFAPAADKRLWILCIAVFVFAVFMKYFYKTNLVYYRVFIPAFVIFVIVQIAIGEYIAYSAIADTAGFTLLAVISAPLKLFASGSFGGFGNFVQGFFSGLYYLAVSTWGLGILGACLCKVAIWDSLYTKSRKKDKAVFAGFGFFALVYNFLMVIATAWNYNGAINGRYIDSATLLLLLFTLCYVFMRGLNFKTVLYATIALGVIFALFFVFSATALIETAGEVSVEPSRIQGLSPLLIGAKIDAPLTSEQLFTAVSATFCFIALLLSLVSCTERLRAHVVSFAIALTLLYSAGHAAFVFLPYETGQGELRNRNAYALSEYVYNSADAPPTYVVDLPGNLTAFLRFQNRETYIASANSLNDLPDDCFVIITSQNFLTAISNRNTVGEIETVIDDIVFVAIGERAIAYAHSQTMNRE
ncbi:MAG: hypothetical protein FWH20_01860 [Oscillospiraceae bacterium]|nr:hypothetical protein [Oscillospiraceae bacterium]